MRHEQFAARFRAACEEAEAPKAQEPLGKFLGVSGAMAWNYLNGEKLPSMDKAVQISKKLGCCVEWLLTGRGPRRPTDGELVEISGLPPEARAAVRVIIDRMRQGESVV